MRLLLVEDSKRLRETIALALRRSGYKVDATGDGKEGLWMAEDHEYDAAILDIMLPSLDGLSILKKLRDGGDTTPVMFLTAQDTIQDRVAGLRSGADDYLVKPFALEELLARVEALCRRSYQNATNEIQVADLKLDSRSKTASRAGTTIDLTPREFSLLEYLMLRTGHVVSRSQIEEHIYDDLVSPMSNVVDSAIYALRKKIAFEKNSPPLIHTRRGQGYVLEERA
ncbi:MAG: response regulator transcription factor [Verrucomicrobiales bacterium]|nr:response regulator transcription factor [Verrucomicrobiales bacterium]